MAERHERAMLLWARIVAAGLAVAHAGIAAWQQRMNPDGVCYLDMGEAIVRADWSIA